MTIFIKYVLTVDVSKKLGYGYSPVLLRSFHTYRRLDSPSDRRASELRHKFEKSTRGITTPFKFRGVVTLQWFQCHICSGFCQHLLMILWVLPQITQL